MSNKIKHQKIIKMAKPSATPLFRFPAVPQILSRSVEENPYGLLPALEGTWVGDKGWNIVTVPVPGSKIPLDFKVLIRPYLEVMTFEKIAGGVPNRGENETQLNYAIKYDLQINDLQTKEGMHAENGMFINQSNFADPKVTRQSIIPHGNSLLAIGDATQDEGTPFVKAIDELNEIFTPAPTMIKGNRLGYEEEFEAKVKQAMDAISPEFVNGFNPMKPINALIQDIKNQEINNTITIDTSTANEGGVLNTPFIKKNADTPLVRSIFWIEEVDLGGGNVFMQMQYAQLIDIIFPTGGNEVVKWPHININTLVKIK